MELIDNCHGDGKSDHCLLARDFDLLDLERNITLRLISSTQHPLELCIDCSAYLVPNTSFIEQLSILHQCKPASTPAAAYTANTLSKSVALCTVT